LLIAALAAVVISIFLQFGFNVIVKIFGPRGMSEELGLRNTLTSVMGTIHIVTVILWLLVIAKIIRGKHVK
jgi:hypothetical protein